MRFTSWLRFAIFSFQRSSSRSERRPRRQRLVLHLEQLETRLTPSYVLSTLASFNGTNGALPEAGLVMGASGNLYGTTDCGGASNDGTVFQLAPGSGTLTTLASFNGANGKSPMYGGVVMDASGNLFGTTAYGGASNDGTVFELAQGSGTITTLASVSGGFSIYPEWGVIRDSSGNLYGVTYGTEIIGSTIGQTVFELAQGSGTITTRATFPGSVGADSGLLMDSSGNLYGTTFQGGNGYGSVYELAQGSGTVTTLASFPAFGGINSMVPYGGLIMDSSGNLYGTTALGGASGAGTVYAIARGSGTITILASFNGSNGSGPQAGLLMDGSGNLYGTTTGGGASNDGTVFELAQGSSTITTLASFNGSNGKGPQAGLIMDQSGNLYGTTGGGGAFNDGTVFELSQSPSFAVSGFPSSISAGVAGSFTVTALNADGTVNTGYTGTVHFTSSDPQAVLPANYTFTAADQGVHTFTATLKTAGSQVITATDTANGAIVGSDTGISVTPAAATSLAFSGVPSSTTAGSPFNATLTAKDAYGNIATGYTGTVHFTSSDARAVLPADYTFTTADQGVHTFSASAALKTAGSQTLTATDTVTSGLSASQSIAVNPAAASQFLLSAPASVTHGTKFSVTLTVEDAYGNVVTGYTGTVHFTSSDSRATLPANYTFTTADAGVHKFTSAFILRTRGKQTLTATDTQNSALTATDSISVL